MIPLDAENIKSALDLIVIDENNDSYYTLPTCIIFLEYYSKDKQFNDVLYGRLNYVEGSNYLIDTSHKALELYDSVSDILGDIHQLKTGYKIPKNTYMKLFQNFGMMKISFTSKVMKTKIN